MKIIILYLTKKIYRVLSRFKLSYACDTGKHIVMIEPFIMKGYLWLNPSIYCKSWGNVVK